MRSSCAVLGMSWGLGNAACWKGGREGSEQGARDTEMKGTHAQPPLLPLQRWAWLVLEKHARITTMLSMF
jgi:hypothetical protein